jgi:hypothetical protein
MLKAKEGSKSTTYVSDPAVRKYIEGQQEKFESDRGSFHVYSLSKSGKTTLIGSYNGKSEANEPIKEALKESGDSIDYIIKVTYIASPKNFFIGPLSMGCAIVPVKDGKLAKNSFLTNTIFFTEDELKTRRLKKNDFKRLAEKLINGEIESNPFKKYTAVDLEDT